MQDRMHLILQARAMPHDLIAPRREPALAFGSGIGSPDLRQIAGRVQTGERTGINLVRLYVSLGDRFDLQRIGDDHPRHEWGQHPGHAHTVGSCLDHHLIACQQALAKSLQCGQRHVNAAGRSKPAVFPEHHLTESSVDVDANHPSHSHLLPDT